MEEETVFHNFMKPKMNGIGRGEKAVTWKLITSELHLHKTGLYFLNKLFKNCFFILIE